MILGTIQTLINKFIPSFEGKLLFVLAVLLGGLLSGWHLHSVWDAYWDTSSLKNQLAKAQAVPGKINTFHKKLKDAHVETDPCWNTPVPVAARNLVR